MFTRRRLSQWHGYGAQSVWSQIELHDLRSDPYDEEIYQRKCWLKDTFGLSEKEAWIMTCQELAAASLPFRIKE